MDAAGCAHGESNLTTSNTIAAGNSLVLAAGRHQHQATTADTCVAGC
jgi:hypothetical protein